MLSAFLQCGHGASKGDLTLLLRQLLLFSYKYKMQWKGFHPNIVTLIFRSGTYFIMYSPSQQTVCRFWRSIGIIRTNDDAVLEMFVIINSTSTHWSLINHSNGVSGVILFSQRVGPLWNNSPMFLIGSHCKRLNTFVSVVAACHWLHLHAQSHWQDAG